MNSFYQIELVFVLVLLINISCANVISQEKKQRPQSNEGKYEAVRQIALLYSCGAPCPMAVIVRS